MYPQYNEQLRISERAQAMRERLWFIGRAKQAMRGGVLLRFPDIHQEPTPTSAKRLAEVPVAEVRNIKAGPVIDAVAEQTAQEQSAQNEALAAAQRHVAEVIDEAAA